MKSHETTGIAGIAERRELEGDAEGKKLRVGQVGVGGFARRRRGYLRESGLFDIVAAYDLSREAMSVAEQEDGAEPMESFEALVARDDLDAVIVSTGATAHAEQALAALERGLPVFIEKPLCTTPEEMRAILDAQRRTGLAVGTGHHDQRHHDYSATTRRLIETGELGSIVAVQGTTAHCGGQLVTPDDWRGDCRRNPGGMLFQCGVHKIHELMYYFGPVRRVTCQMRRNAHPAPTTDAAVCVLSFDDGLFATLHAYHVTPFRHTLDIFGTDANLYRDSRFFETGTGLEIQRRREPIDGGPEPKVDVPMTIETDWCANLRSFYRWIRTGEPEYPTVFDAARAVAVIFACDASAKRGGEPVEVEPIES